MIPADHISFNADGTAWLVFNIIAPLYDPWSPFDRPCDKCGELGYAEHSPPLCPDDCIDGRHTFTIEVENPAGLYYGHVKRRVSVIPGMVLPIYDWNDELLPENDGTQYIVMDAPGWTLGTCHLWTGTKWEPITLSPASRPGMWAVKLKVAQ